jgi:CRISPR system Cascade subunit CasD
MARINKERDMPRFLILKLDGPMQAWGVHTYEDFRPTNLFPTRSGLLGLLGACLGIDRRNYTALNQLADSVEFTVRLDGDVYRSKIESRGKEKISVKLTDYHTVIEARRANRPPKEKETIQTKREYLCDAAFTVAVGGKPEASVKLDAIAHAAKTPVYTPTLGRRSCPLARPLLYTPDEWQEAANGKEALDNVPTSGGLIYAEGDLLANNKKWLLRDVPIHGRYRRFGTRMVFIHASTEKEEINVPKPS